MGQINRFLEVINTYQKHGWQLRRVLLTSETRSRATGHEAKLFGDVLREDANIDALWFARPSHKNREAWELRLVAESPYAFFETFEPDESEAQREEVRREMEARMCERVNPKEPTSPASDSGALTSQES